MFLFYNLFFEKNSYEALTNLELKAGNSSVVNTNNIFLSSSLTSSISILTFIILWFIFIPKEILNLTLILSLS